MYEIAINKLFSDVSTMGFWDSKNNRIHSKLEHDSDWNWEVSSDTTDRYGVFAISLILAAKLLYEIDLNKYQSKIMSYLKYIKFNVFNWSKSTISYGAFNALVFARILYNDKSYDSSINYCINYLMRKVKVINDNHDSLILIGLSSYLKHIEFKENVYNYFNHIVLDLLSCQNKNGYFLTGDIRAFHHQRTMYTLWGLCFASQQYKNEKIKNAIERSLEYVWHFRRDGKDNAFLWHPGFYYVKKRSGITIPVFIPKSSKYLYECHQTFFANAVKMYNHFFNLNKFNYEREAAIKWIFGDNRISVDLRKVTGIDLPARIMTTDGNLIVPKNHFKGSYEVGSYVFALA
tara:strand:+ start:199 stop:1236 length:1038 start_codon:yes stop_codon:yes gene_type:complete